MIQKRVQATVAARVCTVSHWWKTTKRWRRCFPKSDLQSNRFLKVVGENKAALKAGVQLLLTYPDNNDARRTVEDQLRELCERMGFALLTVSAPDGTPLAGVLRTAWGSETAGYSNGKDGAQRAGGAERRGLSGWVGADQSGG